jgi:hypothetical protein
MANSTGGSNNEVLRLDFDRRLMLQFRGSAITSMPANVLPSLECWVGWPQRTYFVVPVDA